MSLPPDLPAENDGAVASSLVSGPRRCRLVTVLEGLIGLAILVGGVLAVRSGGQRSELRREYQRLTKLVGELPVSDPGKVWIKALDTGDSMHFAWRVYLPANYHLQISHDGSGWLSSQRSAPAEFVARVRFRMTDDHRLQVYEHYDSSSGLLSRGDGEVAKFIHQHWDRLKVEQLGTENAVSIEPANTVTLLRLQMPEELQAEAAAIFPRHLQSEFIPTYFHITLGPSSATP